MCYRWELVNISQKLLFVGVMNYVLPGSLTQCVVAIILACGYVIASTLAQAFRHSSDNIVALCTGFMLICVLVLATALKVSSL